MKIGFYILLLLMLIVLAVPFALKNQQLVNIDYYSFSSQAPLSGVILVTLFIGIVIGYLLSISALLRNRGRMKTAQKQAKIAEQKLEQAEQSQNTTA